MKSLVHQKVCTIENRDMIFIPRQMDTYLYLNPPKLISSEFYPDLLATKPSQVIWHGSNYKSQESYEKRPSKQFLFVGARSGYKNFITAAKHFVKLPIMIRRSG